MTAGNAARPIDVVVCAERWRRIAALADLLDRDGFIRVTGGASLADLPRVVSQADPDVVLIDVHRSESRPVALPALPSPVTVA